MFRGFNLAGLEFDPTDLPDLTRHGREIAARDSREVKEALEEFAGPDGVIDGGRLKSRWFPTVDADVFISHSHKDEDLAIALTGWLSVSFGLSAFVDSNVWGYADELLRQVDNAYCWRADWEAYNYQARNRSTSYVHMMLSTALGMMIDRTECLMFLNTPNSITSCSAITNAQTQSPWLYAEIAMARVIQPHRPDRYEALVLNEKRAAALGLDIRLPIPLDRLTEITPATLRRWRQACASLGPESLDTLYRIAPRTRR